MRPLFYVMSVACFSFMATPALACSLEPVSFDVQFENAPHVFIGTVESVTEGKAKFKVENAIRNVPVDAPFITGPGQKSCNIAFKPGQNWLYMGDDQMSGSQLIVDENGRVIEENAWFVQQKFGHDYTKRSFIETGSLTNDCGAEKTPAFVLRLGKTIKATFPFPVTALKEIRGIKIYQTDTEDSESKVSIETCDAKGKKCQSKSGTVYLGTPISGGVEGVVEWVETGTEKETPVRHGFHADIKNDPKKTCG